MNQQNIIQFYPNISAELIPILQKVYQNENLKKYHTHVQSIKSKFVIPEKISKITFPNTENILEYFLQQYQPIILDKQALIEKQNVRIKLFKNAIYFGEMFQEMRQGTGVLIRDNNQIYEGQFALDKKDGIGFEILKCDTYYYGHYVQGVPSGEGVYKSPSHNYIGQWQHGKKCGIGWCSGNRQDYYLSTWENGKLFGYGLHVSDVIFAGEVINDLKFGFGEEYLPSGEYYIGQYKNGQPNGKGKYVWKNGTKYEGEFQNGIRWGEGKWEEKTEKGWAFYKGQYMNDKKNGKGHFKYANGTEYIGEFQDDLRHGYGEIVWPNKANYKGYWHRGLLEGEGIYTQDNKELQGLWKKNQFLTSQKVRMSLNQFPINNQLKDIKEDEEIISQLAEEPDFQKIGEIFNKRNIQSKSSFYTTEQYYQPNLIQKQFDELINQSQQKKFQYNSQNTNETTSIGIQTEKKEKKKLLTELPQIILKKKKIQPSYSVDNKGQVKRKNLNDSLTNTNSPNTRESEYQNQLQYSGVKQKQKKQRLSLLSKIEEKVLKLRIEKEKLSPFRFEKLWNQRVVEEARQLIYPPIWVPPSLRPSQRKQ